MGQISEALRREAGEAFEAYEKVLIERIVRRPGRRLVAAPLQEVLDSGDEEKARAFIDDMRRGREELLRGNIVFPL